MRNPRLEEWEQKLNVIFFEIDGYLENRFGKLFPLKPSRLPRGQGPTPDADGLFDMGVSFSAGFGSKFGPGYVFRVTLATNEDIPGDLKSEIEDTVLLKLREMLPKAFPNNELVVERDGSVFKIFGDLGLD